METTVRQKHQLVMMLSFWKVELIFKVLIQTEFPRITISVLSFPSFTFPHSRSLQIPSWPALFGTPVSPTPCQGLTVFAPSAGISSVPQHSSFRQMARSPGNHRQAVGFGTLGPPRCQQQIGFSAGPSRIGRGHAPIPPHSLGSAAIPPHFWEFAAIVSVVVAQCWSVGAKIIGCRRPLGECEWVSAPGRQFLTRPTLP